MRTTNSIWKRLLSMALVLVMVLGYVPATASALETDVLLKAKLTPVPSGTDPQKYTYTVQVLDKDDTDVTEHSVISWEPADENFTGNSYGPTTNSLVSAEVVYNGMKLSVDTNDRETVWTATIADWTITAGDTIAAPSVSCNGHSSLVAEPVWTITSGSSVPVSVGAKATVAMGELTAKTTIGGKEYTATATVAPAPIVVDDVQPATGWYAEMPAQITVHGNNGVTLEDSVRKITINGVEYDWETATDNVGYTAVIPNLTAGTYSIGGSDYTWQVDAVKPAIAITNAYVNNDNNTVVNYTYTVGPSGGQVFINDTSIGEASDTTGTYILSGPADTVKAKIVNKLNTPDSAETEAYRVTVRPDDIGCSGYISKTTAATFVTPHASLIFSMGNASGNVTWLVNGVEQAGETGRTLGILADDYIGKDLTVSATDDLGRTRTFTLPTITVDNEAPVITITAPDDEPTDPTPITYFNAARTYKIEIRDNSGVIDTDRISVTVNGAPASLSFAKSEGVYTATLTLSDGESLQSITVSADDKAGNSADEKTLTTNVCVDTTAPVITGEISVNYYNDDTGAYDLQGSIQSLFIVGEDTYLVLDSFASNDTAADNKNVKVCVDYALTEVNPDGSIDGWTDNKLHREVIVPVNQVKTLDLSVSARDRAGNVPSAKLTLNDCYEMTPSGDTYTGSVIVDRRAPEDKDNASDAAPKVTLNCVGDGTLINGMRYFKDNFHLNMRVQDADSGLKGENIVVETSGTGFSYPTQTVRPDTEGNASIEINVAPGKECKDGKIGLKIYDNVGNYFYYTENFAVDSLAPRVAVQVASSDAEKKTVGGVDLYQSPVTLTFTLTDMLTARATITYTINGLDQTLSLSTAEGGSTKSITLNEGDRLTSLTIKTSDALGNHTNAFDGYTFSPIKVDGTPAVVTVTKTAGTPADTVDGVEYYNDNVTYTVVVDDDDIDAANGTAKLVYYIDGIQKEINLLAQPSFTGSFTVTEGHALTDMEVTVTDNAGNVTTSLTGAASSYEDGKITYTGNKVAVDNTPPTITVEKQKGAGSTYIQTVGNKAYYKDGPVTYTVTIKDKFLNPASAIIFNGDSNVTANFTAGSGPLNAEDTLTLSYTVTDGNPLTGIDIKALDMAILTQTVPAIADSVMSTSDITFQANDGHLTYNGPQVIVDSTAPTATLCLTGNIKQLVEKNGVYYVELNQPTTIDGANIQGNAEEEITLKLTVKDDNLSLNTAKANTYITSSISGKTWTWAAEGTEAVYTDSVTVGLHQSGLIKIDVSAYDLVGHPIVVENIRLTDAAEGLVHPMTATGTIRKTFSLDRRTPSTTDDAVPQITLTDNAGDKKFKALNNLDLYSGTFSFALNVKDGKAGEETDSPAGLQKVEWTLSEGTVVAGNSNTTTYSDYQTEHAETIGVSILEDAKGETDAASLTITASDSVNNKITYCKNFAFDNLAPRVTVTFNGTSVLGNSYYNDARTAIVEIQDMHMPELNKFGEYVQINTQGTPSGWEKVSDGVYRNTYTFAADGGYTFSMTAKDITGNLTTNGDVNYFGENPGAFVIDKTKPVVTVTKSDVEKKATSDGVDYYTAAVTYTVKVTDTNIDEAGNGSAWLEYSIDDTPVRIDLLKKPEYTFTFTVDEGHALTSMKASARDNAGNFAESLNGAASSYAENEITYTGNKVAVDNTRPTITVKKEVNGSQFIQTVNNKAYYKDGSVLYTVTIQDKFLDPNSQILFNGIGAAEYKAGTGTLSAVDTLTLSFSVTDATPLSQITIKALDMVDLTPEIGDITTVDTVMPDDTDIAFQKNADRTVSYTGPQVIVDNVAPSAVLNLTGNIDKLVEKNGVYYVQLKQPAEGNTDGTFDGADQEQVNLTLTVEDVNLSLDVTEDKTYLSSDILDKTWTWAEEGTKAVYTDSVKVDLHKTGLMKIDVSAYDLVGHPIVVDVINLGQSANGNIIFTPTSAFTGTIEKTFSLDRRTPSTTDDEVPEITLTDNAGGKKFKALNGLDLYSDAFNFTLNVKDGKGSEEAENHAGLKEVDWRLADGTEVVTGSNKQTPYADYTASHIEDIGIAGQGETDNASLTITATDNVDNTITYRKNFAFDNLAPRVTVTVSGTSVRGNNYYNQNRTAVVEIRDIHMPELSKFGEYVQITTQGTPSGWEKVTDGVYRNTYTFATDGEYTFSMTAKDIAGNTTGNGAVTYVGENPTAFIIDKTRPVIAVNFAPATVSGQDGRGVDYYNQNVVTTVTITERNFQAGDVNARFNPANFTLANWTGNIDHRSSVTFPEGNNYSFTINFQDLAGNQAETYTSRTFSVDTTAPTITISRGDLNNKGLNVVPDDLALGLTINDGQKNLSDYKVTVTHLDNSFQKTTVTGADYYTVDTQEDRTTVLVNFNSIAKEKQNDGLYTVEITAKDFAGNTVSLNPDLVFSLNRFGSTFTTSDSFTLNFLATGEDGNAYHNSVDSKLMIQEINPNMVWRNSSKQEQGSVLTVAVNGTSTQLVEGTDYKMSVSKEGAGSSTWYVYTYEIEPAAFRKGDAFVDGRYTILIYGEDEAGNKNTNESNAFGNLQKDSQGAYSGKIEFTLDTTPPIISTTGIESRKTYNEAFRRLDIFLSDNTPVEIVVYLNNQVVPLSESSVGLAENTAWLVWDSAAGSYVLNVPEQTTIFGGQDIRIVTTDAAGNVSEQSIESFYISTNLFVRLLNNKLVVIGVPLLLVAVPVPIILLKKRKSIIK